jgi:threonine/homoserine/homoserine lactone efflux protein
MTLKVLGAAYLIWIAIQTWRHAKDPVPEGGAIASRQKAFISGVMINFSNPKSVFFSAAVLVVIFPPNMTLTESFIIFLNHLTVELIVQPMIAILLSTGIVRARYLAMKPVIDRATAFILGALGLRLLLSR